MWFIVRKNRCTTVLEKKSGTQFLSHGTSPVNTRSKSEIPKISHNEFDVSTLIPMITVTL